MHKNAVSSSFRKFKNVSGKTLRNGTAASKIEGLSEDDDYEKEENDDKKEKAVEILKSVGWFAVKTAAVSGVVIGGIALAVPLLGFTAGGVAAGSAAAAYQSAVLGGTIASGSAFATLQSVGAAGLAASTQAGIVVGSGIATGAHTLIKKLRNK